MTFALEVVRARKGDCLFLHYGSADDPRLILIDGGPSGVYEPHLKPRIETLREERGLTSDEPLPVDILMISHIDDDHIRGILDMTREYRELADDQQPLPLNVLTLWHNSFSKVIGAEPAEFKSGGAWGPASMTETLTRLSEDEEAPHTHTIELIIAGVDQGFRLKDDAELLGWAPNRQFGGGLVRAVGGGSRLDLGGGLTFTVVGPLEAELRELWAEHQKFLKAKAEKDAKEQAKAAAYIDESAANLSSIVVLAEADGRSMLLTGDARGDKVVAGLRDAGLLAAGEDATLHVDILKVPHHGSANNLEESFFRQVTADHYVFTGDGEHGNPERESFEMLLRARPDADFTLHIAYPVEEIDAERKKDWEQHQERERAKSAAAVAKGKPARKVREDWSDADHGLIALFAAERIPGPKRRLEIVPKDRPHILSLA